MCLVVTVDDQPVDLSRVTALKDFDRVLFVTEQAMESHKNSAVQFVSSSASLISRINLGISLADSEWIFIDFNDRDYAPSFCIELHKHLHNSTECVHIFYPDKRHALPVVAMRRKAFAYGSLDPGFPCPRLCVQHWIHSIFQQARQRFPSCDGLATHYVDWLISDPKSVENSFSAFVMLHAFWSPEEKDVLFQYSSKNIVESAFEWIGIWKAAQIKGSQRESYYEGTYNARSFWETNTRTYVKWEAYQPDESEIEEIVRTTNPAEVLELGCGVGRNIRYFRKATGYTGIDISLELLKKAQDRREPNVRSLTCGDICSMPFSNEMYDLIFANSTLQHVEPDRFQFAISEIRRLTKRFVAIIEFTNEIEGHGKWFDQKHMFRHDYPSKFDGFRLVYRRPVAFPVQPALKEVFLFEKL